jgi:hypothetical protein
MIPPVRLEGRYPLGALISYLASSTNIVTVMSLVLGMVGRIYTQLCTQVTMLMVLSHLSTQLPTLTWEFRVPKVNNTILYYSPVADYYQ